MAMRFDVFLSHNSMDKPAVRELAEALRARGLRVWLDEWELVPGRPWQEALEEIIETARCSAVLVGKDGLGPWQDAEMRGCLSEFVERKLPVIPVLLPGAPVAPKLPLFLKRFTWVDLRKGLSVEGVDLLQWGITGRKPDRSASSSAATSKIAVAPVEAKPDPRERLSKSPQRSGDTKRAETAQPIEDRSRQEDRHSKPLTGARWRENGLKVSVVAAMVLLGSVFSYLSLSEPKQERKEPNLPGSPIPVETEAPNLNEAVEGSDDLRAKLEARYSILPIHGGIVLTPRNPQGGVHTIEVLDETVAINGEVLNEGTFRTWMGGEAELILRLLRLRPGKRRALFGFAGENVDP